MTDDPTDATAPTPPRTRTTKGEKGGPSGASGGDPAGAAPDAASGERHADVLDLSYEQARDELASIVARLEGGSLDLEESMRLWERGEALAAHCSRWLDGAEARLTHAETARDTD